MFSDLPGIDPDFDSGLQDPCRGQISHSTYNIRTFRADPKPYEVSSAIHQGLYQHMADHPLVEQTKGTRHTYYDSLRYPNESLKSAWYPCLPDALVRSNKYPPWPAKAMTPGMDSPSPPFTDGTGSEDDSNASSSQWGIETAARDYLVRHHSHRAAALTTQSSSLDDAHGDTVGSGYGNFASSVGYSGTCIGPGIKMEDVQPDSYQDENFNEVNDHEPDAIHIEPLNTRVSPCSNPEDHALSPASSMSYTDNVKEGSISEDEDDASDYSPRSYCKPKLSQATRSKNPGQSTNKVPTRFSRRSSSGRVIKRSQKARGASEATTPSSNRISCPHCTQTVNSKANLTKHIATAHTRPFTCTFREYGCMSTFGSKNEWKRHVSSQHLRLGFWRCNLGRCYPEHNLDGVDEEEELIFNDFNRKDLFMQHLRRMHAPHASSPAAEKTRFNAALDSYAQDCFVAVRGTPPRSACGYCTAADGKAQVFEGHGAWEARMEHVGRHLESGYGDEHEWAEDQDLKGWLAKEGLIEASEAKGWRLVGLPSDERGRRR